MTTRALKRTFKSHFDDSSSVRSPPIAVIGVSKLAGARRRNEEKTDRREDRTPSDPRALVNHEA